MHRRRGVYGLIVVLRRFKAHLVGRCDGRFVQAMTQASHHPIDMQLSVCAKHYFQ